MRRHQRRDAPLALANRSNAEDRGDASPDPRPDAGERASAVKGGRSALGQTSAWLECLATALVDLDCSDESYEEIEAAAFRAVPAEEADELRRRLRSFAEFAEVFPLHARSVEESVEPVLEGLLRVAEEHREKASA